MYRVYLYMLTESERPEDAVRYTGRARYESYDDALKQLDLDMSNGASGGDIERHVDGIGWVLADDVEA